MTRPPKPLSLDTTRLAAFVAAGRLWLVDLMVWLASVLGVERVVRGRLHTELRALSHAVAVLAFAQARHEVFAAALAPVDSPRGPRPCARGLRRREARDTARVLWRCLPRGAGLAGRCAALRRAIDDLPALVRRMARVLKKALRHSLALTAPPCEALCAQMSAPVCARDTS